MSCGCDSKSANLQVTTPDPGKHVNYLLGMVLGEDDFRQEFAYHANRDMWLARDLIGYGTVRGLAVSTEAAGSNEVRVRVEAGVALSPNGQLICVPEAQCAELNGWLKANAEAVHQAVGAVPAKLTLYLTLCYRACPTDAMPIPGEPCRSDAELTQPSRLADDFCLGFKLQAPAQREEDAIRDFCQWLRQVDMRDNGAPSTNMDDFLAAIRNAAAPWLGSPPGSPPVDYLFASPPAALHIAPGDVTDYLRAAFQLWITELRPKWVQRSAGCAPNCPPADPEDCCSDDLLLAEFSLDLIDQSGVWLAKVSPKPEPIIQPAPSLLHLRMLQEWLLGALGESAVPSASDALPSNNAFGQVGAAGTSEDYSRADHQHPTPVLPQLAGDVTGDITSNSISALQGNAVKAATPGDGSVLVCRIEETGDRIWAPELLDIPVPGTTVSDETSFGQAANAGNQAAYARADHTHGTPSLSGDLGLDSSGKMRLLQLQGNDLKAGSPQDGQLLGFDKANAVWRPFDAPQGGSGLAVTRPIQEPYAIVAAGWVMLEANFGLTESEMFEGQMAKIESAYNGLRARTPYNGTTGGLRLSFDGFSAKSNYIVKLTPVTPFAFVSHGDNEGGFFITQASRVVFTGIFERSRKFPDFEAGFGVMLSIPDDKQFGAETRFMVEVSEFMPDGQG